MKTMLKTTCAAVLALFVTNAMAEETTTTTTVTKSDMIRDTSSWKSYPIKIDSTKHTYVISGETPDATATDYYYSYPGHRCFVEKRDIVGVDVLVFKAGVSGGSDIYCYPE